MANALLIQEPPLQVLPSLAQKIGLNEAIILQQIHYWLNPKHNKNLINGRLWVWNTYEQWKQQFPFWCDRTIRRAISNLEGLGLLDSFITKDFRKLKHYSINYTRLEEIENSPAEANKDVVEERPIGENLEGTPDKNGSPIGFRPSGQNDQIDLPKRADRAGQNDQIDRVNLTRCINIDTETTLSENTPHPLNARESDQMGFWKEEEEGEMKSIGRLISQNPVLSGKPKTQKEEEEEKINLMILSWNQIVQRKLSPNQKIFLTPKRSLGLKEILEKTFLGNLGDWEVYCTKIANTRFLMRDNSSGFKVTLDWALNVNNAIKILEGSIYDKSPKSEVYVDKSCQEILVEIKSKQARNPLINHWLRICQALLHQVKQPTFRSWFLDIQLQELTSSMIVLQVENDFKQNYLSSQLKFDLERAIRIAYPSIKHIDIIVKGGNSR